MDNKFKTKLNKSIKNENLNEHVPVVEKALKNIGLIPGEVDVKTIISILKNEIKENNIKTIEKTFSKHPEIVSVLREKINDEGIKSEAIPEMLRGKFDKKKVTGVARLVKKIEKNNEIVLTGKLREHFNKEETLWEG